MQIKLEVVVTGDSLKDIILQHSELLDEIVVSANQDAWSRWHKLRFPSSGQCTDDVCQDNYNIYKTDGCDQEQYYNDNTCIDENVPNSHVSSHMSNYPTFTPDDNFGVKIKQEVCDNDNEDNEMAEDCVEYDANSYHQIKNEPEEYEEWNDTGNTDSNINTSYDRYSASRQLFEISQATAIRQQNTVSSNLPIPSSRKRKKLPASSSSSSHSSSVYPQQLFSNLNNMLSVNTGAQRQSALRTHLMSNITIGSSNNKPVKQRADTSSCSDTSKNTNNSSSKLREILNQKPETSSMASLLMKEILKMANDDASRLPKSNVPPLPPPPSSSASVLRHLLNSPR